MGDRKRVISFTCVTQEDKEELKNYARAKKHARTGDFVRYIVFQYIRRNPLKESRVVPHRVLKRKLDDLAEIVESLQEEIRILKAKD